MSNGTPATGTPPQSTPAPGTPAPGTPAPCTPPLVTPAPGGPVPHHNDEREPIISDFISAEAGVGAYRFTFSVSARLRDLPDQWETIKLSVGGFLGKGSFGQVARGKLHSTDEMVAVKEVMVDKESRSEELNILRKLHHCNTVELKCFFYTRKKNRVFLNLVMEYLPFSLRELFEFPTSVAMGLKLFSYQMFRGLAYLHNSNICHLDLKPDNILVDPVKCILKLCDFGNSKVLVSGVPNTVYKCTRFYRAPELLFGNMHFTCKVDVWSAGCILAEMHLRRPLFMGCDERSQLLQIFLITGTPTLEDVRLIHPFFADLKIPRLRRKRWDRVMGEFTPPEAVQLISSMLKLRPSERLEMLPACAHSFYDELRQPDARLYNGFPFPPLFNFTPEELASYPNLTQILVPLHHRQPGMPQPQVDHDSQAQPAGNDVTNPTIRPASI